APVKRQSTRGATSSFPGTARLPPCISFSTSYPELDDTRSRTSPLSFSGTLREKDRLSLLRALDTIAVLQRTQRIGCRSAVGRARGSRGRAGHRWRVLPPTPLGAPAQLAIPAPRRGR